MRLFVALPMPDDVREALLDPMEGLIGARWQDADNLHITLRFIGDVSRHQADDLVCALAGITWCDFPLALRGVGHFEKKGRATAIWAAVAHSAELSKLQVRVEHACRRAGLAAETRKFIPHVTLARLNSASGNVTPWLTQHAHLALGPWTSEGFALFESELTPGGSVYSQVARFPPP